MSDALGGGTLLLSKSVLLLVKNTKFEFICTPQKVAARNDTGLGDFFLP